MVMNKCLYCYGEVKDGKDYHQKCSLDFFGTKEPPIIDYTMDEMEELAKNVVESSVTVPGVQPKLSLGFIKDVLSDKNFGRLTVLGALGGNFILKPQNKLYPEMPENEHLTMKMAEVCGISTVPSSLIRLKSGELSYITKRVDRTESGDKIHMLDMFQILEAFDKYKSSMEKVGKAVSQHSSNTLLDMVRLFEIVVFSFVTGNNDMHLKNFSLLKNDENWVLAPAYDMLNVNLHLPEDKEESALTINAKKSRLVKKDFIQLGENYGLNNKQIENTFKRFLKVEKELRSLLQKSFLSTETQQNYDQLLRSRLSLLGSV